MNSLPIRFVCAAMSMVGTMGLVAFATPAIAVGSAAAAPAPAIAAAAVSASSARNG